MAQADWERSSRGEEFTSGKLGIRDNGRCSLTSNSNWVGPPLTFDHCLCTEEQLKLVSVVRDFGAVKNSRRWKRLQKKKI